MRRRGFHGLDNRLTDGGKIVSPTHRPRSTPKKHYFSACGTHFWWRLSERQGPVRLEGLGELKKFIHLIGLEPATFKFNIILQQYTTLLLKSLYMLHTSLVGGMSSERTCTSFHSLSSSWRWCILPTKHVILKVWVKMLDFVLLSYSLHITVHIWLKILTDHMNIINDNFLFTMDSILLSRNVLDETNKKGNCQLFMYQTNCPRQSCNLQPSLYMSQKVKVLVQKSPTLMQTKFRPHSKSRKACQFVIPLGFNVSLNIFPSLIYWASELMQTKFRPHSKSRKAYQFVIPLGFNVSLNIFPSLTYWASDISVFYHKRKLNCTILLFLLPGLGSISDIYLILADYPALPGYLFILIFYQTNAHISIHIYIYTFI
jgi:hypothetical protein